MIIPVSVQFQGDRKPDVHLAIALHCVRDVSDVREFRSQMLNLLSGCVASAESLDNFTAEGLWWLTQLIDATTTTIDQELEKGGTV